MTPNEIHEDLEMLTAETREMHRALRSLIEELEAVDWYSQRVDASGDEELRRVMAHNRDEEKEHACMTLEWIRRRDAGFDARLHRFLFRSGSIVAPGATEAPSDRTLEIGSLGRQGAPS